MVEKVEVVRVGKARRAKLFYLRDRVGKAAKTKEKVGARIETNEIVVKEEVVPGEAEVVEENIDLGESNEYFLNATWYYYSEEAPTKEGNFWHYDGDSNPVAW